MKTFILIVVVIAVALLVHDRKPSTTKIHFKNSTLTALVADEPDERRQGLGGRATLPSDTAMLFVFPDSGFHGIWMKDMQFPIDIVWLDDEKQVVDIRERISPDTHPEIFRPAAESRYVVEFASGSVQRLQIGIGSKSSFSQ